MIDWLIYIDACGWQIISTTELKERLHDGLCNRQVWRLIKGRQPENRYIDNYGIVRDVFGNVEVL